MARSVDLEWSDEALADLDRFATFLHDESPELAAIVAQEIAENAPENATLLHFVPPPIDIGAA